MTYIMYGNTDKEKFYRLMNKELECRGLDVQDIQFEVINNNTTKLSFKKNKDDQPTEFVLDDNINDIPLDDTLYVISKEMGWFN